MDPIAHPPRHFGRVGRDFLEADPAILDVKAVDGRDRCRVAFTRQSDQDSHLSTIASQLTSRLVNAGAGATGGSNTNWSQ